MEQMMNILLRSNPLFQRAVNMAQGKSESELREIAINLCRQRGMNDKDINQFFNQFKNLQV